MKKIVSLLLAAGMAVLSLSAQETEKKQYLPEAGDWAIGFDAKPILNYVGNVFNGTEDNEFKPLGGESALDYGPTVSLMGKYMLTDEFALKANIGVLLENDKQAYYVQDDAATVLDPLADAKVADYKATRRTGVSLLAGAEYRLGKKRIQGVFGAGVLFGLNKTLINYSYGNEMTSINQRPSVAENFNNVWSKGYRTIKEFTGRPDFYAGVAASAGVEFFVAPKLSLGAEVSLVAAYNIKQQTYTYSEGYNPATEIIERKTDLVSPMTGTFYLGTQNLGGSLYLSFFF